MKANFDSVEDDRKELSLSTIAIPKNEFRLIVDDMMIFLENIFALASSEAFPNQIYQLNTQLIQVSQ